MFEIGATYCCSIYFLFLWVISWKLIYKLPIKFNAFCLIAVTVSDHSRAAFQESHKLLFSVYIGDADKNKALELEASIDSKIQSDGIKKSSFIVSTQLVFISF